MKRRAIETRKILAVALGAVAGCSAAPGGDVPSAPASIPQAQVAPAASPVPEPAAAKPVPERQTSNDPALLVLRHELAQTRGNVQNQDHFRPLCDKDGYPLVGNLMRKTPKQDYQPSAFCADLRAQAKR